MLGWHVWEGGLGGLADIPGACVSVHWQSMRWAGTGAGAGAQRRGVAFPSTSTRCILYCRYVRPVSGHERDLESSGYRPLLASLTLTTSAVGPSRRRCKLQLVPLFPRPPPRPLRASLPPSFVRLGPPDCTALTAAQCRHELRQPSVPSGAVPPSWVGPAASRSPPSSDASRPSVRPSDASRPSDPVPQLICMRRRPGRVASFLSVSGPERREAASHKSFLNRRPRAMSATAGPLRAEAPSHLLISGLRVTG